MSVRNSLSGIRGTISRIWVCCCNHRSSRQQSPLGVVFASLFVSGLQIGANAMQVEMGIPSSIVFVCQSIIILLLMVIPYVVHRHRLHRAEKHMRKKMTPKDECIE